MCLFGLFCVGLLLLSIVWVFYWGSLHNDMYNLNYLSFIEIESFVKEYGYRTGDLLFYQEPEKSLSDGMKIVSGDPDVL